MAKFLTSPSKAKTAKIFNQTMKILVEKFGIQESVSYCIRGSSSEAIALCESFETASGIKSTISIYLDTLLEETKNWSENTILATLQTAICHEVAHHLHALRFGNLHSLEEHPPEWEKIMEDEMGAQIRTSWTPLRTIPKILTGESK